MSGVKISALPAVPSAQLTDIFPVVQGGVTYQESLSQVATLFGMSGGILSLASGGTSASLTASNGGIVYSTATTMAILSGVATAGKVLQSGATAAPTWSTPTYPSASATAGKVIISDGTNFLSSTSIWPNTVAPVGKIIRSDGTVNTYTTTVYPDLVTQNSLLYGSASNTIGLLATVTRSVLTVPSTGLPTYVALTDGQLIVGSTAGSPAAATLSAGPGISISNASNAITISGTGSGIGWTEVTGTTQAMVADNGYVANNGGLVTLTLPATAAFGTAISLIGKGAGGWLIAQNAGQNIQIGSSSSSVGVGGSVASTNRFDAISLICTTANTTWTAENGPQSAGLTIV